MNPDPLTTCPYCAAAIAFGEWHTCDELRASGLGKRLTVVEAHVRRPPLLSNILLVVVAVLVFAYLGAHLLVGAGVPCPT